jgi:hypothetical protein
MASTVGPAYLIRQPRIGDCMTSDSDSTSRRRPPTIDLTATEVGPDKPASAQDAGESLKGPGRNDGAPESAPGRPGSIMKPALAGAAIGAIVIAAGIAGLDVSGYLPLRQSTTHAAAPAPVADNEAITDITAQLNKIQGAISAQQPDTTLASRLGAVEAATKSLSNTVTALNTRVDQIAGSAQAAQAQAKSAADAADTAKSTAQSGVVHSDIDALTNRIAALEGTVKSLSDNVTRQTTSADDGAARLTIAAEALRAAVERGAPYQAELTAVEGLGADQNATAPLEPFAASGVPGAAALAIELATLVPALTEAVEPKQTQSTFLDRIKINAQRLVRSTPVDAPAGDDPQTVAIRISFDASHGDINAALADTAKLPDAAKGIAAPWVQKAQARATVIAASRQLAANALAALSKPQ